VDASPSVQMLASDIHSHLRAVVDIPRSSQPLWPHRAPSDGMPAKQFAGQDCSPPAGLLISRPNAAVMRWLCLPRSTRDTKLKQCALIQTTAARYSLPNKSMTRYYSHSSPSHSASTLRSCISANQRRSSRFGACTSSRIASSKCI
jgi:hypothetical protein